MRERYGSAKLKELCCLKDWPSDGIERSIKSDEAYGPIAKETQRACHNSLPWFISLVVGWILLIRWSCAHRGHREQKNLQSRASALLGRVHAQD